MTTISKTQVSLGDDYLIRLLIDKLDEIPIFSDDTKTLIKKFKLDDGLVEQNNDSYLVKSESDDLSRLWKELLIDSIHYLKLCDRREKAFFEKTNIKKKKKLTLDAMGADQNREARKLNVFGVAELADYFEEFSRFENVLYGFDPKYRDHVLHPLRVWLVGAAVLLDGHAKIGYDQGDIETIVDNYPQIPEDKDKLKISKGELWAMWTIIALCHDLGYPLEKAEQVNDALEGILKFFGRISIDKFKVNLQAQHQHLIDLLLQFISSKVVRCSDGPEPIKWKTGIQTKYYTKFAQSWEKFNHGIVSCLVLQRMLTYFLETDYMLDSSKPLSSEDARQYFIRREILRSIASHTTEKVYHVKATTLAFLLIVCDEAQEWGRPTMGDMRRGDLETDVLSVKLQYDIASVPSG